MHILIVDDEYRLRTLLKEILEANGFTVTIAANGETAEQKVRKSQPDVAVIDLNLTQQGISGEDLIKSFSEKYQFKIFVLSNTTDWSVQTRMLELGAHVYCTKPYDPQTLIATIRAQTRSHNPTDPKKNGILTSGSITFNLKTRVVTDQGKVIDLSRRRDKQVLEYLMEHPTHVKHNNDIINRIYSNEKEVENTAVEAIISSIRKRFERTDKPKFYPIKTIRGEGYRLYQEDDCK